MNKNLLFIAFAFLFINLVSINKTKAQEHVFYDFNTDNDAEGWESTAGKTVTVAGGVYTLTEVTSWQGIWSSAGLNLSESDYTKIIIEIENNTNAPTIQLYNLDIGADFKTGGKEEFDVPMNDGYHEITVDIPAGNNGGIIDRLSLRSKKPTDAVAGSWNIKSIWIYSENSTAPTFKLTTNVTGAGAVSPSEIEVLQTRPKTVDFSATAYLGYKFSGWSGDASGTDNPLSVSIDADKNITANFVKDETYTGGFEWNFNTDGDLEGWFTDTDIEAVAASGIVTLTSIGNWPRFKHANLGVSSEEYDMIEVKLKNNTEFDETYENPIKFVYNTLADEGTNVSRAIPGITANDVDFKTYTLKLGNDESWTGFISILTFMNPSKVGSGVVEVDYIKLLKGSEDNTLSSLITNPAGLSPAFSSEVNEYTLTVPNGTTTVNVSATATDQTNGIVNVRQITMVDDDQDPLTPDVEVATVVETGDIDLSSGSAKASVRVEAENGALKFYTIQITVGTSTAINNFSRSEIKFYPNPTDGNIYFNNIETTSRLTIYNTVGKLVLDKEIQPNEELDLSDLQGVYFLKIKNESTESIQKLIVR